MEEIRIRIRELRHEIEDLRKLDQHQRLGRQSEVAWDAQKQHEAIYAQIVPASQRRALQQLSAFASGGSLLAVQQTAAMDLDFPTPDETENAEHDTRSNSRSKPVQ